MPLPADPVAAPLWAKALAWLANGFYFSRFLIQWIASERSGKPEAPPVFWWLSLLGSVFMALYTWQIGEPILTLSYLLVLAIYVRNLGLARVREGHRPPSLLLTVGLAVSAWGAVLLTSTTGLHIPAGDSRLWLVVAVVGTAVWSSRFVVQWLESERAGVAHFPRKFWWLSLVGNTLLLAYVIHLGDVPLIAGLSVGPLVQARNLVIAYRNG